MTDNHKENTSKTVDDGHMAAHAVHDDVKTSTHTMHKDADVKSQVASGHEKTDSHTPVSESAQGTDSAK